MSAKPPPDRPFGTLDLLDANRGASPRDEGADPVWRADALGRSRHSRLASEVREPLEDSDSERAERLCAELARDSLGDLAPGLLLLSSERRRRAQVLTAWTIALFDLALRPGLAGLDGDRLAQINAWEFRTEEALDGAPAGQPVFVMLAAVGADDPWPRDALDEIVGHARRRAVGSNRTGAAARADAGGPGRAVLTALFGEDQAGAARLLGPLVDVALAEARVDAVPEARAAWLERLEGVRVADAPSGWRAASAYARRALRARLRGRHGAGGLGLFARLRYLAASLLG